MSFMQPVIERGRFQIIHDTPDGDIVAPEEAAEYPGAEEAAAAYGVDVEQVEVVFGYGARLSAPGYMDCTDWSVFDTEKEAADSLLDMYGDGFDDDETAALQEVTSPPLDR